MELHSRTPRDGLGSGVGCSDAATVCLMPRPGWSAATRDFPGTTAARGSIRREDGRVTLDGRVGSLGDSRGDALVMGAWTTFSELNESSLSACSCTPEFLHTLDILANNSGNFATDFARAGWMRPQRL